MDAIATFWLGAAVSALVALGGWYLTKKSDDARSRREGNLDNPVLATTVLGFKVPGDSPLQCTYVLEDVPESIAAAMINVGAANAGNRPAEDVLLIASFPDLFPKGARLLFEASGLFPGREVKLEKIGKLQQASLYLPHLTPGTGAALDLSVPLNETRVLSTHEIRSTEGDLSTTVAIQFEYALTFNVQLVSKERIWPGASAHIRVTHGRTLVEVAAALRDKICEEDRVRFKYGRGGFVTRALSALRYLRFRVGDDRRYYFIVPALRPAGDAGKTTPLIVEDNSKSVRYFMFDAGREWILVRDSIDSDGTSDALEVIVLPPES